MTIKGRLKIAGAAFLMGFGWCIGFLHLLDVIPSVGIGGVSLDIIGMGGLATLALTVTFKTEE